MKDDELVRLRHDIRTLADTLHACVDQKLYREAPDEVDALFETEKMFREIGRRFSTYLKDRIREIQGNRKS